MSSSEFIRSIAFYLPQFHPIAENDRWWGKGFTEWTNVTRSASLFKRHYQPHLPADLGFYDLRLQESRAAQAALAQAHGLHGFCYYHYWFMGRKLLQRPFDEVLATGEPNFPFCLCWANETWSRRWLGEEQDILLKQDYSAEDDRNHARSLIPAFEDQRYIRVDGRPLFLIYRPMDLPCAQSTTDTFRQVCLGHGLPEPYLVGVNAHCPRQDCRLLGFDHTLNFSPQLSVLRGALAEGAKLTRLIRNLRHRVVSAELSIYDYAEAVKLMQQHSPDYPHIPSAFVGWDNTPRRGAKSIVLNNQTPELFAEQLHRAIDTVKSASSNDQLLFVNAWNEWAEGNHLEPDQRNGLAYLEALRVALAATCNERNVS